MKKIKLMKTAGLLLLPLCLALLLTGCQSSYRLLKSDQENGFRLSDYATYGFYDIDTQGDVSSPAFEKNIATIKEAVSANMVKRGLNEAQEPSLKVNIAILVKEEVQTRQTNFLTDGYPRYMGQRRYSWKSEEVPVGKYKEGTMLLELVDASNDKLVWKGGAKGVLSKKSGNISERINDALADIFQKMP
jgi:hypothetical protein